MRTEHRHSATDREHPHTESTVTRPHASRHLHSSTQTESTVTRSRCCCRFFLYSSASVARCICFRLSQGAAARRRAGHRRAGRQRFIVKGWAAIAHLGDRFLCRHACSYNGIGKGHALTLEPTTRHSVHLFFKRRHQHLPATHHRVPGG